MFKEEIENIRYLPREAEFCPFLTIKVLANSKFASLQS